MSVLTPLFNMDDNMRLGTPDFFSLDVEQNGDFTGAYQSKMGDYGTYEPAFQPEQAENNQLDYFSVAQNQFNSYAAFQTKHPPQSQNEDLEILSLTESFFGPSAATAKMPQYDSTTILEGSSASNWDLMAKSNSSTFGQKQLSDTVSARYGQITPVAEDSKAQAQKDSSAKSKQDDSVTPSQLPKAKKPRKSKRKPLSKEQEEAKRKKFLERNRVAADKCRQNRKKWIDDL